MADGEVSLARRRVERLLSVPHPRARALSQRGEAVDPILMDQMKAGNYFYKHDFGRQKRGRKHLCLSADGLSLKWKSVGANEVVAPGGGAGTGASPSARLLRSASFSRTTNSEPPTAPPRAPNPR